MPIGVRPPPNLDYNPVERFRDETIKIINEEVKKCFVDNRLIPKKYYRYEMLEDMKKKILNLGKGPRVKEIVDVKKFSVPEMNRTDLTREITKLFDK